MERLNLNRGKLLEFLQSIRERFCRHYYREKEYVGRACLACIHNKECRKTPLMFECIKCGKWMLKCIELYDGSGEYAGKKYLIRDGKVILEAENDL